MLVQFTPSGGSTVTLGDDSVKNLVTIERLGTTAQQQVAALFEAEEVLRIPRGNLSGECVFIAEKSHDSITSAITYFRGEVARANQKGALVFSKGATTLTMNNAFLVDVSVVRILGVLWAIRYSFGIGKIV
jgi:hypothetical protein